MATVQQSWSDENQREGRGDWELSQGKLGPRFVLLPEYEICDRGVVRPGVSPRLTSRKNKQVGGSLDIPLPTLEAQEWQYQKRFQNHTEN